MTFAMRVELLSVYLGKNQVLWDVNFEVPRGKLVAIVGPNGAGKSTLLKTAVDLIAPFSGKVELLGGTFDQVRSLVAYVPQRESIDWDFPITAIELVLMGRYGRLKSMQRPRKVDRDKALEMLALVSMEKFSNRQIGALSGGQQQKLFFARALAQEPELFFLDEPFSGIDHQTEEALWALLKKERDNGGSIFVVHHDLSTVKDHFDWVIFLNTRHVASGPVSTHFTKENLRETFGRSLFLFSEAAALSKETSEGTWHL